jgi:hypothetical protein
VCHGFAPFESRRCPTCRAELGLHLPTGSMVVVSEDAAVVDGSLWVRCTKAVSTGCNRLVPEEQDEGPRGRCLADSLIRREPKADDTIALEKLADTTTAMHRLILQLLDIGLPVEPFWRRDGGLAFDLLSSYSEGERVTIGHANGVITIDLVESLDAYRESLRVRLGEPYRTMLGHFRHEVGHYYQEILVETGSGAARYLDDCRALFGDERADYQAEIVRHYKFGPPANWHESFISEYATMHPWEDFAKCFAHYLHITDSIGTVREAGLVLHADKVRFAVPRDIVPLESYDDTPIERLLSDWRWLSLFFNRVNTAMGKNPLYPFTIPTPVVAKLGFIHRVARETAGHWHRHREAVRLGGQPQPQGLALAYGPTVRVNTLMPGPFLTDVSKAWDIEATTAGAQRFALKRLGQPAEIVGAALFLASDASSYTSGSIIRVDGGIP